VATSTVLPALGEAPAPRPAARVEAAQTLTSSPRLVPAVNTPSVEPSERTLEKPMPVEEPLVAVDEALGERAAASSKRRAARPTSRGRTATTKRAGTVELAWVEPMQAPRAADVARPAARAASVASASADNGQVGTVPLRPLPLENVNALLTEVNGRFQRSPPEARARAQVSLDRAIDHIARHRDDDARIALRAAMTALAAP
jgi:hypothetical protein